MENNNIDKLFKSKLADDASAYDPAAWGRMAALIDEDEGSNPVPPAKRSDRSKYLGLLLLLIFASAAFGLYWKSAKVTSTVPYSDANSLKYGIGNKNSTSENPIYTNLESQYPSDQNSESNTNNSKTQNNSDVNNIENHSYQPSKSIKSTNASEAVAKVRSTAKNSFVKSKKATEVVSTAIAQNEMNKYGSEDPYDLKKKRLATDLSNSKLNDKLNGQTTENLGTIEAEANAKRLDMQGVNKNIPSRSVNEAKANVSVEQDDLTIGNEMLSEILFLSTSTSDLFKDDHNITPVMTSYATESGVSVGILSNLAYRDGYFLQVGPSIAYPINSSVTFITALQFEYMNMNDGQRISVLDKVYSFGSSLENRMLVLDQRNSFNLPINLQYKVNDFSILGGLSLNYHLATKGLRDDTEGNEISVWVSDDSFKKLLLNYQLGFAYRIDRSLELNASLIYRPRLLKSDIESSTISSKIYPSVGFNYLIAKY